MSDATTQRIGAEDVIRVHDDPGAIDGAAWDALLERQAQPTPFMRHRYLAALHDSGSAVPDTGWWPQFITLHRGDRLIAAAPAYLKQHSYGEYVFDWAWADAYQRHGLNYYPKLLVAVPFTPVPGSRLLAIDDPSRAQLASALRALAQEVDASSVHLLFHDQADGRAATAAGWLSRHGVQFHWTAPEVDPPRTFEALLATMQRDKRKKIQQERRKVAAAGIRFTVHEGEAIDPGLWDFFMRCYRLTYRAHHSSPYLTRDFFARMAATMAGHWVMFVARLGDEPIAVSLIAVDRASGQAFGRYWGCIESVPCLHFEACYYQPLQWCIENGLQRFEGGAQGEHKMARGLLPVGTCSSHWLAHPQFAQAVDDFLRRESRGIAAYVDELAEHSPFKARPAEDREPT
ncbi:GNAT family N-acetyltransferase [Aquabacterium humicola]|uniref:GNAT family N-acetyltransferase n=1 Tax=Aquabacterium humicola TaxID=3237377 RepID=UPI003F752F30